MWVRRVSSSSSSSQCACCFCKFPGNLELCVGADVDVKDFQKNWLPGKINGLQGSSVRKGCLFYHPPPPSLYLTPFISQCVLFHFFSPGSVVAFSNVVISCSPIAFSSDLLPLMVLIFAGLPSLDIVPFYHFLPSYLSVSQPSPSPSRGNCVKRNSFASTTTGGPTSGTSGSTFRTAALPPGRRTPRRRRGAGVSTTGSSGSDSRFFRQCQLPRTTVGRPKIPPPPLDRFLLLHYSAAETVAVPKVAVVELSRREHSDNASFDFGIFFVVEYWSF